MRWVPAFLLVCASFAQNLTLPGTVRQGDTIRIHASAAGAAARMGGRSVRLFRDAGGESLGLMPVPADEKPGEYPLEILDKAGAAVAAGQVRVVDAHFLKQNVTIAESVAELKPSPGETETVTAFRNTVSEQRHWEEPLALPVRGCMTSTYGVQRYLNGKPTGSIHAGLDQRAPAGTPIRAATGGTVKIVREWNLHGRTVAIDHGQGLESIYLHMSKQAVAEGAVVNRGDIIGYSGSTGRSNAPHLHWSLYVNGVAVNPLDWVKVAPCSAPKKSAPHRERK